jgi:hypothetical protein
MQSGTEEDLGIPSVNVRKANQNQILERVIIKRKYVPRNRFNDLPVAQRPSTHLAKLPEAFQF